MAVLANFVFLDTSSTGTTSSTFYVPYGADSVMVQATGTGTLNVTIKGKADTENGNFIALASINQTDYSVAETITAEGIYSVATSGIREMQVVNGGNAGSVTVFGAAIGEG